MILLRKRATLSLYDILFIFLCLTMSEVMIIGSSGSSKTMEMRKKKSLVKILHDSKEFFKF